MKKTSSKKLNLSPQTIRALQTAQLAHVVGGAETDQCRPPYTRNEHECTSY